MLGETSADSIGTPTCSDGQWCVQEMGVNAGVGQCASLCDPTMAGACPTGEACIEIGVSLMPSSPVVHVCGIPQSDASFPTVDAGGAPPEGDAATDAPPVEAGGEGGPTVILQK
jgi:hypothetical protein